jgi:hypothetical protein
MTKPKATLAPTHRRGADPFQIDLPKRVGVTVKSTASADPT